MRLTASRTSLVALSMSRDSENSMVTFDRPFSLFAEIVRMPSMPLIASSTSWVIRDSMTAAVAPR